MSLYVFGYGSLMLKKERAKEQILTKVYPVTVLGLKRSFNVSSSGGKYKVLGIKESSKPTVKCNGVLMKITSEEEMTNLLKREKNYTPKKIASERLLFNYKKQLSLKPDDQIIVFYPQPKFVLKKKEAQQREIRPNYLNICLAGAAEQGTDFLADFKTTTLGLL